MDKQLPNCPKCGTQLVIRTGKFGRFLCCPESKPGDNHGTVSLDQPAPKVTGQTIYNARYHSASDANLDQLVQRQMASFGVLMTDLDRFVEGGPETADYDEEHWTNMRPY